MGSLEGCRHYLLFAVVVVGALGAAPHPAQAQCEGDALRLCTASIPDRDRVKSCLLQNLNSLSPDCRSQFREGQGTVRRRRHHG
ncbi:MAG: hypothetical protein WAL80_04980 [Xanthobacteraceae bacterium]|jgi:hypothetical protein